MERRPTMRTTRLRNVHPGEVLAEEFLKPLGVTQYLLAKRVHVPQTRIAEICRRRRGVTVDTALRLAKFFGTSSKFWLGLQEDYDLEEGLRTKRRQLDAIQPFEPDATTP
jgi:addiction module HigA family antidote